MTLQWTPTVQLIQDTLDKVNARDTNRPLKQLELRTRYLYERLQSIAGGEALISQGVTLEAETKPGSPVYFDPVAGSFKRAWAGIIQDEAEYGYATAAAQVRGIVLSKSTTTSGDVLLEGRAPNTYGIDWTQVIDGGSLVAGTYYLSAVTPGNLTTSRSVLSVYLGTLDSAGTILFHPEVNGSLRNHLHYRFDLLATISANLSGTGWVPVAQFVGAGIPVPPGATYGYNIGLDASLSAAFPPVPLTNHYLEFVGRGVHEDAYVLDENGLWWVDGSVTPDALTGDSNFPGADKYYRLWIAKLQADVQGVSTLAPSQDANVLPVVFRNSSGLVAATGELVAALESLGSATSTSDLTGTAVKTINGVKFTTGPVVSTLVAGENISLEATAGDASGRSGVVRISAGTNGVQNGEPSLVALNNAVEDFYGTLPCVVLPKSRTSSLSVKVNIPTNFSGARVLRLTLDLIGTVTLASQTLNLGYQRVRVGEPIVSGSVAMPAYSFNLTDTQVTRVTSSGVSVVAGDTVYFTVTQPNAGITYSLPILRLQYELSST